MPPASPDRPQVIVVGLGAMGSAVCAELARRGVGVVGLDRFHPPHEHGSTHGDTRITRLAIGEGPEYAPLVRRSHELWRRIERESGESVLHEVGGLVIGDRDDPFLAQTRTVAREAAIAHEDLSRAELQRRFPMFATPAGTEAYLEPGAGYLRPEAGVRAQLTLAARAGARLRFDEAVDAWSANEHGVTVTTARGELAGDALVLCAGAWVSRLVPESAERFAVYPQFLHWFPIRRGYPSLREMPIFIWQMAGEPGAFTHLSGGFYGFPAIDGPTGGVKVATERYDATVDPDAPSRPGGPQAAAALYAECLSPHFPWVEETPLRTVSCLYTSTRGSRFLIGTHPGHANVTIVAACSGHGFKHSPAIGEAVAERIVDGASVLDLEPFAFPRGRSPD